jgi:mono/diheme cytochrome c family protein
MTRWMLLALLVACGSARRGEPVAAPPRLDRPELVRGQRLFQIHCYKCHPGGEGGLGPSLNSKPLPAAAMKLQIRKGVGAMPSFSERTIADDDVDAIVSYLVALR